MSAIIDLKPDSYSLCKGHPPSPRPWVITNILDHNTFDPELTTTSSGNIFTIWEREEFWENIWRILKIDFFATLVCALIQFPVIPPQTRRGELLWSGGKLGWDGDWWDLIKVPCLSAALQIRFTPNIVTMYLDCIAYILSRSLKNSVSYRSELVLVFSRDRDSLKS